MSKNNFIETAEFSIKKQKNLSISFADDYSSFTFRKVLLTLKNDEIISEDIIKELNFPLSLSSQDEIFSARLSTAPGFILKVENLLYYSQIPYNLNLKAVSFSHLCAINNSECSHLIATPSILGGCPKVQDRFIEFYDKNDSYSSYIDTLEDSKRIEKYDFISLGFETFNTISNTFCVIKCNNYEKCVQKEEQNKNVNVTNSNNNKKQKSTCRKKKVSTEEFWKNLHF